MGVLKYFDPPGTCFVVGVLKHFETKIYKDVQLYQVFLLNCFKHSKNQIRKLIHNFLSQNVSLPQYCILLTQTFRICQ